MVFDLVFFDCFSLCSRGALSTAVSVVFLITFAKVTLGASVVKRRYV